MMPLKTTILLLFCILSISCIAQPDLLWQKAGGGTTAYKMVMDDSANIYLAGYSYYTTVISMRVVKYNPAGVQVWNTLIGFQYGAMIHDMVVDKRGNVYVTGEIRPMMYASDMGVVKFNYNGVYQWYRTYNNGSTDDALHIGIDSVCGIYIGGRCDNSFSREDAVIIKYDSAGNQKWLRKFTNKTTNSNPLEDMLVTSAGDVYFTGTNDSGSTFIIKYDSAGTIRWNLRYSGGNAQKIVRDIQGNILAAMFNNNGSKNFSIVKFDPSGTLLYDSSFAIGMTEVSDMFLDKWGNAYICGLYWKQLGYAGSGYETIKFGSDGTLKWQRLWDNPSQLMDWAKCGVADDSGNVYIAGMATDTLWDYAIVTLKYDSTGTLKWSVKYENSIQSGNTPVGIIKDPWGNIYVGGHKHSPTSNSPYDFLVLKYGSCEPPPPVASGKTICSGSTASLSAKGTPNGKLSWYSDSTGGTWLKTGANFVTPPLTVHTTFYVQDSICAPGVRIPVLVKVTQQPEVFAHATDTVVCAGKAVTLKGSGYQTYAWSGGVTDGVSFVPVSTATYSVIGSDGKLCSDTTTITIKVNQLPNVGANASAVKICEGTSVTLSGSGAGSYSWSGGVSDQYPFIPDSTAVYYVTGTDSNKCFDTASITVVVHYNPMVTAIATSSRLCAGSAVTLSGSGAKTYSWTSGVIDGLAFIPASTNTYTVTGTDSNSCSDTAIVTVTVDPLPNVTAGASDAAVCPNTVVILRGSGAQTYSWTGGITDGAGFIPASTQTYIVTGTDTNNCSDTALISVKVHQLPLVTATSTALSVCEGTDVTLTGGGAVSYSWSGGVANGSAFIPAATNTYTVAGTDSNSCVNTALITITVNKLPVVVAYASSTVVCEGDSVTLTGSGAVNYAWTSGVINGLAFVPSSTNTYEVIGTDGNNCRDTATISVRVNKLPFVSAVASAYKVCAGTTVTLHGNGALNYSWTSGVTDGAGFIPSATSNYVVKGTDANNCSDTAALTILVDQLPVVGAHASSNKVCAGAPVTLTGSGAASYSWSGGVTDGLSFIPMTNGDFTVTGTDSNNCTGTATISIRVDAMPDVSTSTSGITITSTQAGASYQWLDCDLGKTIIPGAFAQSFTAVKNGNYAVVVTLNTCSDTSACLMINSVGNAAIELLENSLLVFPNPSNGELTIKSSSGGAYAIINGLGQAVLQVELNAENKYSMDIKGLSAGVYYICGYNAGVVCRKKFVVVD
jgi:hypothetical protein